MSIGRARMHPWTLKYDDDALEAELRTTVQQGEYSLQSMLFHLVMFISVNVAGYTMGLALVIQLVSIAIMHIPGLADRSVPSLSWAFAMPYVEKWWLLAWTTHIGIWWLMLWCGRISRIDPDETERIMACTMLWMIVMITQRVLHFSPWYRASVAGLGLTIILSGECTRKLLVGLVLGEMLGYTMERMLRDRFLDRCEMVERLQQEKERRDYDLAIARSPNRRRARNMSLASESSRRAGSVRSQSSYGTSSELASLHRGELHRRNVRSRAPSRERSVSPVVLQPQALQPTALRPPSPPSRMRQSPVRTSVERTLADSSAQCRPIIGRRLAGGLP